MGSVRRRRPIPLPEMLSVKFKTERCIVSGSVIAISFQVSLYFRSVAGIVVNYEQQRILEAIPKDIF
jgi:hypothetical protein